MSIIIALLLLLTAPLFCTQQTLPDTITVNAVGDIMMGTLFPEERLPPENGQSLFKYVTQFLTNHNADIVMGNLEGPITSHPYTVKTIKPGRTYAFRMPPSYTPLLKQAGFNILNTANNHANDFGPQGYSETRKLLKEQGIAAVGNKDEVVTRIIKGKRVSVIGFYINSAYNSLLDIKTSMKLISAAATNCDILILTFHGGAEGDSAIHIKPGMETYLGENRGNLIEFCHQAIDNGADLIIGHSPHVPRGMELYKGRLIAYSLGNFVTYRMAATGYKKYTLVLSTTLNLDGTFHTGEITPLMQFESGSWSGIPQYDAQFRTVKLIRELSLADFPGSSLVIETNGSLVQATNQ